MWRFRVSDNARDSLSLSIEKLSRSLKAVGEEQDANAAVVVLLMLEDGKLCVLFVRRVKNSLDPWSGQVALPGGKRDAKDRDLKETVIRETLEETNIDLLHQCRFLGAMPAFQSRPRPEIKVIPFVVFVENRQAIRLNKAELEDYFWFPVEELSRNRKTATPAMGGYAAFILGKTIIWGLTYRIVENLVTLLESGTSFGNNGHPITR